MTKIQLKKDKKITIDVRHNDYRRTVLDQILVIRNITELSSVKFVHINRQTVFD